MNDDLKEEYSRRKECYLASQHSQRWAYPFEAARATAGAEEEEEWKVAVWMSGWMGFVS